MQLPLEATEHRVCREYTPRELALDEETACSRFRRRLVKWLFKQLYPLALRERIYARVRRYLPRSDCRARLWFGNTRLEHLSPTDVAHAQIYWLGFYELELSKRIACLGKRGGLLVDVGANAGYYTCMWAALNPGNQVTAFEASPRTIPMLTSNVKAAGLSAQVQINPLALGNKADRMPFELGPPEQTGWGGLTSGGEPGAIEVEVRRLDELLAPGAAIEVLKIDTEGADTWVLKGAEGLLRAGVIRHLFFEMNSFRMARLGIDESEPFEFLRSVGYAVKPLGRSGTEFWAYRA